MFDTEGKSKVSCLVCQGNNYISLNHRELIEHLVMEKK